MNVSTVINDNAAVEHVTDLALGLTPHQQALLLARLHDNLQSLGQDPEHEAAWAEEIDRRLREIENGEAELIDHEVAMKMLRERFLQQ